MKSLYTWGVRDRIAPSLVRMWYDAEISYDVEVSYNAGRCCVHGDCEFLDFTGLDLYNKERQRYRYVAFSSTRVLR